MRGAWIEIASTLPNSVASCPSLPVRGAWIEIALSPCSISVHKSLPVRGAWIEIRKCCNIRPSRSVAPRAGSVD